MVYEMIHYLNSLNLRAKLSINLKRLKIGFSPQRSLLKNLASTKSLYFIISKVTRTKNKLEVIFIWLTTQNKHFIGQANKN